jgi:hypothetical protein
MVASAKRQHSIRNLNIRHPYNLPKGVVPKIVDKSFDHIYLNSGKACSAMLRVQLSNVHAKRKGNM